MTYTETRERFESRCAALLPNVLHSSFILDEIHDTFPELHTAEREYVCALDSHEEIIRKTDALTDDEIITLLASYISDAIVSEATDYDDTPFQLTQSEADEIMTLVRRIDPTDSSYAASVRDAIRDNFEEITL